MVYLVAFLAFLSGFLTARYVVARLRPVKTRSYLLLYDGSLLTSLPCKEVASGIVAGSVEYAAGISSPIDIAPGFRVYFSGIERVALADYRSMQIARRSVDLRYLFKGGGDFLYFIQFAASVVPVIVSIWLTLQFGGMVNVINNQGANIQFIRDRISNPIEVKK